MSEPKILDAIDKRILRIIQKDASLSINEIASRVGLSQTPCWKRLQRLEAAGVIKRRIALLDPMKLGLGITVFVTIEVGDHSASAQKRLTSVIASPSTRVRVSAVALVFTRLAKMVTWRWRL